MKTKTKKAYDTDLFVSTPYKYGIFENGLCGVETNGLKWRVWADCVQWTKDHTQGGSVRKCRYIDQATAIKIAVEMRASETDQLLPANIAIEYIGSSKFKC